MKRLAIRYAERNFGFYNVKRSLARRTHTTRDAIYAGLAVAALLAILFGLGGCKRNADDTPSPCQKRGCIRT